MTPHPLDVLLDDLREAGVPVRIEPGGMMQVVFDICVFGATPAEACAANGVEPERFRAWEARLRELHRLTVLEPEDAGRIAERTAVYRWFGVTTTIDFIDPAGGFALVEHVISSGALFSPLHRNVEADLLRRVEQGGIVQCVEGRLQPLGAGEAIFVPRRTWQAMWNPGPEPARIVDFYAPAGLERFFMRADAARRGPDVDIPAMVRENQIELADAQHALPRLLELEERGAPLEERLRVVWDALVSLGLRAP